MTQKCGSSLEAQLSPDRELVVAGEEAGGDQGGLNPERFPRDGGWG